MIIDIHTHIFPEKVAQVVLANAEKNLGLASFAPGTQEGPRKEMDESGTDLSVVLGVAPDPKYVSSINDWLLKIQDDRVQFFGDIHPDMDGWEEELKWLKDHGVRGLKLNSLLQNIRPDDPRMYKIYEKATGNFVMLFHAGGSVKHKYYPEDILASPQGIAKVLDDFPDMKVIAAHFGGNQVLDQMKVYLLGREVYLDTSYPPRLLDLPPDEVVSMIQAHGVDKILFGTDFPWETRDRCLQYFRNLKLTEEEKEKILGRNARELLFG
jgi:predicted TIM-barrel fold metal-dependent hydrolase